MSASNIFIFLLFHHGAPFKLSTMPFFRNIKEFKGPLKSGALSKCLPCLWVKTGLLGLLPEVGLRGLGLPTLGFFTDFVLSSIYNGQSSYS